LNLLAFRQTARPLLNLAPPVDSKEGVSQFPANSGISDKAFFSKIPPLKFPFELSGLPQSTGGTTFAFA